MTLRINPAHLVSGDFGCLEPAQPEWLDQLDYWEDFNTRFFRSNGRSYDPAQDSNVRNWLTAPDRAPFSAMADQLLETLAARVDLADIDLVLLAHWMPDLHLGTSVTNFVQYKLGIENGLGFAISDRGPSAPLFALDLAARYLRAGRRRALVMAMDQKHLLYRAPLVGTLAPRNSAAVVLLEAGGSGGLSYAGYVRKTGLAPADLPGQLAAICADAGLARAAVTVVAAPELAALVATGGPVRACQPGWLCAGPFAALAAGPSDGLAEDGPVLLATFEAGELATVLLRPSGSTA